MPLKRSQPLKPAARRAGGRVYRLHLYWISTIQQFIRIATSALPATDRLGAAYGVARGAGIAYTAERFAASAETQTTRKS